MILRKTIPVSMAFVLLFLCGCGGKQENTVTHFALDTVVTLTACCEDSVLQEAFSCCRDYENRFSRTVPDSDVARLNASNGESVTVGEETAYLLERSLYYAEISGGRFDITVCPVSVLWDFADGGIPSADEIAAALPSVDYHRLRVNGTTVETGGTKVDLGGIAKGYIADRLAAYLKDAGATDGLLNLGGNVVVYGKPREVGIAKPFADGELAARITVKDAAVVTSGIYQRYVEKDGVIYHHVLDPTTGYGVQNDLASATVIGPCSADADALSTVCLLLGREKATELIEKTDGVQAVFIDREGHLTHTSGLARSGDHFTIL